MIGFFRKIRKQLADDNKPLKYARYAIDRFFVEVIWYNEKDEIIGKGEFHESERTRITQSVINYNNIGNKICK